MSSRAGPFPGVSSRLGWAQALRLEWETLRLEWEALRLEWDAPVLHHKVQASLKMGLGLKLA